MQTTPWCCAWTRQIDLGMARRVLSDPESALVAFQTGRAVYSAEQILWEALLWLAASSFGKP
ncbi:hypothetical protein WCLP8_5210007 [uncultured Gammaproteobacteria bacterium]